jgi:hypothetical protein
VLWTTIATGYCATNFGTVTISEVINSSLELQNKRKMHCLFVSASFPTALASKLVQAEVFG